MDTWDWPPINLLSLRNGPTYLAFSEKPVTLLGMIGKLHVNPEEHFTKHLDFRAISSANFDRKSISAYAEKAGMFFSKK